MPPERTIRSASTDDAAALIEIYRPYVESSSTSFELIVPSVEEFAARIATALAGWCWLVAEIDGVPAGYAYGTSHRAREAYKFSVETSTYVKERYHRKGIARALYTRLFSELYERGYRNAYAGITLPNDSSEMFHRSMGFKPIGVFPSVGRKFDRWHDVAWLHRPLQP